jgi:hypothetical protein
MLRIESYKSTLKAAARNPTQLDLDFFDYYYLSNFVELLGTSHLKNELKLTIQTIDANKQLTTSIQANHPNNLTKQLTQGFNSGN